MSLAQIAQQAGERLADMAQANLERAERAEKQRDELLEALRVSEQALSAAVLGKTAFVGTALTEVRAVIDKATSAQRSAS